MSGECEKCGEHVMDGCRCPREGAGMSECEYASNCDLAEPCQAFKDLRARMESLEVERDIYRTLALRHEARIAELEGALREARAALDTCDLNGQSGLTCWRGGKPIGKIIDAVLNAPANATDKFFASRSKGISTPTNTASANACTGCDSTETIEEIRAKHPEAISCCIEDDEFGGLRVRHLIPPFKETDEPR